LLILSTAICEKHEKHDITNKKHEKHEYTFIHIFLPLAAMLVVFFYALEKFFNFFQKSRVVKNASKSPYGEQGINSNKNPAQRRNSNET
jgi:hypothetical protein